MAKYHFIYKTIKNEIPTGITLEAESLSGVIEEYFKEVPLGSEFIAMYCIETASALLAHQIEQADKFPTPELFLNLSSQNSEQE